MFKSTSKDLYQIKHLVWNNLLHLLSTHIEISAAFLSQDYLILIVKSNVLVRIKTVEEWKYYW